VDADNGENIKLSSASTKMEVELVKDAADVGVVGDGCSNWVGIVLARMLWKPLRVQRKKEL
jgi:hypothetical protein